MDIAVVDFETYYTQDYSLSVMQTDAYVLDPLFEVIGVSVKINDAPTEWFTGTHDEVRQFLHRVDWSKTAFLAHNTLFDGFIAAQRFGIRPKLWMDTLAMFRALHPSLPRHGVAAMAKFFGLPDKGEEVSKAKGMRRVDFTPGRLAGYGAYCVNDTEITYAAFKKMKDAFPVMEYALVDRNIRLFTEPLLELDLPKLQTYLHDVVAAKGALLAQSGVTREDLMSSNKFAKQLEALGVPPPTKISTRTGKQTYAFARTDEAMMELLEHDDPMVQALVSARLGHKTTLAETRAQKFIETAQRGKWPVYYNYWGAKTTGRFSGGNKINAANLPKRGKDKVLRQCIVAPKGYKIVAGDSSTIELRVNMAVSGQQDLLDKIVEYDRQGKAAVSDLYCDFASKLYNKLVPKRDPATGKEPRERTIGKIGELSLGYGAGAAAFQRMLRIQAGVSMPLDECEYVVNTYRNSHVKVKRLWNYFENTVIPAIHNGNVLTPIDINAWFLTTHNGFALPGHLGVVYDDLVRDPDGGWTYRMGGHRASLYGSKGVENVCQHGARHIVMWQLLRFATRYPVVMHTYDEIVSCVPEEHAADCAAYLLECLRTAPPWCRGVVPVNGEVYVGDNYGDLQ